MSSSDSDDNASQASSEQEEVYEFSTARRRAFKRAFSSKEKKHQTILLPYTKFARWYMRSEDMMLRWDQALRAVIAYESRKYGKLTQAEYRTKHKNFLRAYEKLKSDVPWFEVDWPYFSKKASALSRFCTMLDKAASTARSEDIHSLKEDVLHYIALTLPNKRLEPHIPVRAKKSDTRGFNHIQLARLLCPVSKLGEFDKAPEKYSEDMREGVTTYLGVDLPSCLWPHNGYDPDQTDSNLFRSPVLLSVFKHIFTSPTSAVKNTSEKPKTRHPQATLNGMECVTAGSILYAAMMYRHAITSLNDWRDDEKVFLCSEFFTSMMNFFDEDDPEFDREWMTDLFEFYNVAVFGTTPRSMHDVDNDMRPTPTYDTVREQRRQRRQEREQERDAREEAARSARRSAQNSGDAPGSQSQGSSPQGENTPDIRSPTGPTGSNHSSADHRDNRPRSRSRDDRPRSRSRDRRPRSRSRSRDRRRPHSRSRPRDRRPRSRSRDHWSSSARSHNNPSSRTQENRPRSRSRYSRSRSRSHSHSDNRHRHSQSPKAASSSKRPLPDDQEVDDDARSGTPSSEPQPKKKRLYTRSN